MFVFQKPTILFLDMNMEKNSVHIHDVPIKSILLMSISISHFETRFPFKTPTKGRYFPLESWSQSGKRTETDSCQANKIFKER